MYTNENNEMKHDMIYQLSNIYIKKRNEEVKQRITTIYDTKCRGKGYIYYYVINHYYHQTRRK